jgi:hypothetical protein
MLPTGRATKSRRSRRSASCCCSGDTTEGVPRSERARRSISVSFSAGVNRSSVSSIVSRLRCAILATGRSRTLTDYPTDLLNSPPQVLEAQVVFRRSAPALAAAVATVPPGGNSTALPGSDSTAAAPVPVGLAANTQGTPRNAFTELITTPQLSLGKTVVAAYLVGTRGTAPHALYLGLIVTAQRPRHSRTAPPQNPG